MKVRACICAARAMLSALMLASIGCVTPQQTRPQVQDEPPDEERYELKVVGEVTDSISNAELFPVTGVGLVTGLNGTGSAPTQGSLRSRLERELQQKSVRNVKALLEDKNNS